MHLYFNCSESLNIVEIGNGRDFVKRVRSLRIMQLVFASSLIDEVKQFGRREILYFPWLFNEFRHLGEGRIVSKDLHKFPVI